MGVTQVTDSGRRAADPAAMTTAGVDQVLPGEAHGLRPELAARGRSRLGRRRRPGPARPRVLEARRPGPGLPGLHGRRALRAVAARRAPAPAASRRLRQPAFGQPGVGGLDAVRGRGAGEHPRVLQRLARRVRRRVHGQRDRGAPARRRVVPVRARRPPAPDRRQPQLGQRHPRVRASEGRGGRVRPALDARPARRRRGGARRPRPAHAGARACSPTRRSPTTPASAIRSPGSTPPTSAAGTSSSTRRRSCPRTGSTSTGGGPTSSRSPGTRSSATRRASGPWSPATRPSAGCGVRGSRAAASASCRWPSHATRGPPATRGSKTARSTTWACRASRSGSGTWTRSACPSSTAAPSG